jgi:hypothetical protein
MSSEVTRYVQAYALARQAPRRVARTLLALFFSLIALAPPVWCLALQIFIAGEDLRWLFFSVFGALCVVLLVWGGVRHRARRARQRALEDELAMRLLAAGYAEDADEPGAIAIRAAFWQRAQRAALDSLRIRLASREQSRDMLDALRRPARKNKPQLLFVCGCWMVLTLIASVFVSADSGDGVAAFMSCWLISLFSLVTVGLYLLSLAGLGSFVNERAELRELRRETRRVVNLIETAGGLSLAEGEVRDILQGAIEPALGAGELEMSASEGGG